MDNEDIAYQCQLKIAEQVKKLIDIGWKVPSYSDRNRVLKILEVEHTGIYTGYCDDNGDYYIVNNKEIYPTTPMLVLVKP